MAKYSPDSGIRVALIEESPIEREYLIALVSGAPGVALSAVYQHFDGTLPELREEQPDLVLVDLAKLDDVAVSWLRELRRALPYTAVLVLSDARNRNEVLRGLEAGVSGWLQKPCPVDQILRAIVILHEGGAVLSSPVARKILEYFQARGASMDCLSSRERDVLRLLAQGLQAPDISARLGLTPATVRTHVRNLLLKLKATSRTQAVARYLNPVA